VCVCVCVCVCTVQTAASVLVGMYSNMCVNKLIDINETRMRK